MNPAHHTVFVYYKLPATEMEACWSKAERFSKELQQRWPEITVRWMRRPDASPDGLVTWMEIYTAPHGIPAERIPVIDEVARAHQLPFPRFSEIFVPLNGLFSP